MGTFKSGKSLVFQLLGHFPSEVRIASAEVTVGSSLLEDGSAKLEISDDGSRAEVEVAVDNRSDFSISLARSLHAGAVGIDEYRQGVGDADSVRELN